MGCVASKPGGGDGGAVRQVQVGQSKSVQVLEDDDFVPEMTDYFSICTYNVIAVMDNPFEFMLPQWTDGSDNIFSRANKILGDQLQRMKKGEEVPFALVVAKGKVPDRNFKRGLSYYSRKDSLRDEYISMVFNQTDDDGFRTRWNETLPADMRGDGKEARKPMQLDHVLEFDLVIFNALKQAARELKGTCTMKNTQFIAKDLLERFDPDSLARSQKDKVAEVMPDFICFQECSNLLLSVNFMGNPKAGYKMYGGCETMVGVRQAFIERLGAVEEIKTASKAEKVTLLKTTLPNGEHMVVGCCHLNSNDPLGDMPDTPNTLQKMIESVKGFKRVLIGADCNFKEEHHARAYEMLLEAGFIFKKNQQTVYKKRSHLQSQIKKGGVADVSCKDYIFVRGDDLDLSWDGALTGWDGSLLPNPPTQPSDHVMVRTKVRFEQWKK